MTSSSGAIDVHARLSGVELPDGRAARRAHRFVAARLRFDAPRAGAAASEVRRGDPRTAQRGRRGVAAVPVVSMGWRRPASVVLHGAQFVAVRDTVPADVVRIDRACKVFVLALPGRPLPTAGGHTPSIELAVRPDDLQAMWAGLRLAGLV